MPGFFAKAQKLRTSIRVPGDYSLVWNKREAVILLCGAGSSGCGVLSCFRKKIGENKFQLEWEVKKENSDFLGVAYLRKEKMIAVLNLKGGLLVSRWDWVSGKKPGDFKPLVPPGKINKVINFDIKDAVLFAPLGEKADLSVQYYDLRKSVSLVGADVLLKDDGSFRIKPDYGFLSLKAELADWPVFPGQHKILVKGTKGSIVEVLRLDGLPRKVIGTGRIERNGFSLIEVSPLELGVKYCLKVKGSGFESSRFSPARIVWHSREGFFLKGEVHAFSGLDVSLKENDFNVYVPFPFERRGSVRDGWAVLLFGVQCYSNTPPTFSWMGKKFLDPIGAAIVKNLRKNKRIHYEKGPVSYWGLDGFKIPRGRGLGKRVFWFQWIFKINGKGPMATNCYGFLVWPDVVSRGKDLKRLVEPKANPVFGPEGEVVAEKWLKGSKVFKMVDGKDFVTRIVSKGP